MPDSLLNVITLAKDLEFDENKLKKNVFSGRLNVTFNDGSVVDLTDYIKIMRIEGNFEEYVMPIMFTKLHLRPDLIILIQNDPNVTFRLTINSVPEDTTSTIVYDSFITEMNFQPIRMDRTPINYSDKLLSPTSENYQYEPFEFIAVPKKCLENNKPVISGTFNNASVTDVLSILTNKLNCSTKIEPPDNEKIYTQILTIPSNVFANIKFIDDTYGIYNKGSKYFFTTEDQLIISSKERFFKGENGFVSVRVRFPSNNNTATAYDIGCYRSEENLFVNTIIDNIKFSSYEDSLKEIFGNNQYYLSRSMFENNKRNNSFEVEMFNKPFTKSRVFINNYNNEQKENEFFDETRDNSIIQLFFDNLTFHMDDAFKTFLLNFDNVHYEKLNGYYYALNMGYHFVKKQSTLDLKGLITLKKIDKTTYSPAINAPFTSD